MESPFILNANTLRQIAGFELLSDFEISECNRRAVKDIETSIRMRMGRDFAAARGYKLADLERFDEASGSWVTIGEELSQ